MATLAFPLRSLRRARNLLQRPERGWSAVLLAALAVLVAVPLLYIVANSFVFDASGPRLVRGARPGAWTLFYWVRVLAGSISRSIFYQPALNSLLVSAGMTVLSMTVGSLLAWLVVRTDLPWKRFYSVVLIVPYIVPSWTVALAWIMVFKSRRFGGTPGLLSYAFATDVPEWIAYGYLPIAVALGIHYIPYTFILARGVLANIDSRLEESAEILGAGRLEILRRVTFPLALPALGSAFVLTFSKGLGEFATQAFLGLPVRFYTLSTRIYSALNNRLYGEGYVLSLILILTTAVTVWMNQRILGTRKGFVTVEGKGSRKKAMRLGAWRWPAALALLLFVLAFVLGPLALLGWQTLMRVDGRYGLDNLTLHYWVGRPDHALAEGQPGIFRSPLILAAVRNSVALAVATALIGGIAGILIGYAVVRARGRLSSRLLEGLSFVPYMIPGIAFGGIYLTMFARSWGPLPALYGTFALLVLACTVKHLPYASSAGTAAMHQIDPSLEEAGLIHGIGWCRRFTRIVLPLTRTGLLSAMLLTFITTMRVLDVVVLLVTPKTTLMTSLIFRYQSQEFTQHAYAIMLVIVAIVIAGHTALNRLGGKIEL
jgi:iron(III) transport system permease protein